MSDVYGTKDFLEDLMLLSIKWNKLGNEKELKENAQFAYTACAEDISNLLESYLVRLSKGKIKPGTDGTKPLSEMRDNIASTEASEKE